MTDADLLIHQRLTGAAERWRAAEPAVPEFAISGTRSRSGRRPAVYLAAAAAVAAAVVVPFLLAGSGRSTPTTPSTSPTASVLPTAPEVFTGTGPRTVEIAPPPPGTTHFRVVLDCVATEGVATGLLEIKGLEPPNGASTCGPQDPYSRVPVPGENRTSHHPGSVFPYPGFMHEQTIRPDGGLTLPVITVAEQQWRLEVQYLDDVEPFRANNEIWRETSPHRACIELDPKDVDDDAILRRTRYCYGITLSTDAHP